MPLIDPAFLQTRSALPVGRFDVDALTECDSTNSELLRRAEQGAPSGSLLISDRQTAGRGRRGRSWLSQPEDSLTFSLLWRFTGSLAKLSGLSLAVGVALAQGLEKLGATRIGLKWPNDVLLRQDQDFAKLAGILIELSSDRRGTQAIIGIGLNLQTPRDELPQPAIGLAQAMQQLPDRHDILAALLASLAEVLDRFSQEGFAALHADWQAHHVWQGQPVQLLEEGQTLLDGQCLGVDTDGTLLIATSTGVQRVHTGDLSLRRT